MRMKKDDIVVDGPAAGHLLFSSAQSDAIYKGIDSLVSVLALAREMIEDREVTDPEQKLAAFVETVKAWVDTNLELRRDLLNWQMNVIETTYPVLAKFDYKLEVSSADHETPIRVKIVDIVELDGIKEH